MLAISCLALPAGVIYKALPGRTHGLGLILALSTGMRPSEYLALTWKDIDLDQSRLAVQRSLYRLRKDGWRVPLESYRSWSLTPSESSVEDSG